MIENCFLSFPFFTFFNFFLNLILLLIFYSISGSLPSFSFYPSSCSLFLSTNFKADKLFLGDTFPEIGFEYPKYFSYCQLLAGLVFFLLSLFANLFCLEFTSYPYNSFFFFSRLLSSLDFS